MIEVRYKARLGNNLFQYALGRILAEELGFALRADPIPGFPKTNDVVDGIVGGGPEQILSGQKIDLDAILADRTPRKLVLDGWFQRSEYYWPHGEKIRRWFMFDSQIASPVERPDVVVHVRRTDYVQVGWALPFSFYETALERLAARAGQVWIMTDDRRDPFLKRFRRWRPRYFDGSALEQMAFMAAANRLVMSQSTYSWWPAFLGNHDEVVCPVPSFGMWASESEPDGTRLIDRERFTCIECGEPYRATDAESRYQWWRTIRRRVVYKINGTFGISLPLPSP